jgi:hypothetical protein
MTEVPLFPCLVQSVCLFTIKQCAVDIATLAITWCIMTCYFASHLGMPFSFVIFSVFLFSILLRTNAANIMLVWLLLPTAATALCNGLQNVANEGLIQSGVPRDGVLVSLHSKWSNSVDWGCRGDVRSGSRGVCPADNVTPVCRRAQATFLQCLGPR